MDKEWIGKAFRNKSHKQSKKTVKTEVKMQHVNKKNHKRESKFLLKHHFLTLLRIGNKKIRARKESKMFVGGKRWSLAP